MPAMRDGLRDLRDLRGRAGGICIAAPEAMPLPLPLRRIAVASVVGLSIAIAAGCSAPAEEEQESADSAQPDDEEGAVASTESELGGCNQCSNCVLYARCRQRRLPSGLTTWGDKLARINSHRPRRGCVAMIQTGSAWGHVAYVNGVNGSRISIDEGNWPSGRCGQRSGTPAALNVRGYWCP